MPRFFRNHKWSLLIILFSCGFAISPYLSISLSGLIALILGCDFNQIPLVCKVLGLNFGYLLDVMKIFGFLIFYTVRWGAMGVIVGILVFFIENLSDDPNSY